jgi:hypothetical protein
MPWDAQREPEKSSSPKAIDLQGPSAWTNQLGPCVLDAAPGALLASWPGSRYRVSLHCVSRSVVPLELDGRQGSEY